jgi:hypothetical protein
VDCSGLVGVLFIDWILAALELRVKIEKLVHT